MKLREVAFFVQGVSVVLNFTHPEPVSIVLLSYGVGTMFIRRKGGVKTAEIVRPTKNPTNNQNNENIIFIDQFFKDWHDRFLLFLDCTIAHKIYYCRSKSYRSVHIFVE